MPKNSTTTTAKPKAKAKAKVAPVEAISVEEVPVVEETPASAATTEAAEPDEAARETTSLADSTGEEISETPAGSDGEPETRRSITELAGPLGANGIADALEFLVRAVPAKEFWEWLSLAKNRPMQTRLTKGFQRTPAALRQPPVRHRLERELLHDVDLTIVLFRCWSATNPPIIKAIKDLDDDEKLIAELGNLWGRFGGPALFWSLLCEDKRSILEVWNDEVAAGRLAPIDAAAKPETAQPETTEPEKPARKSRAKAGAVVEVEPIAVVAPTDEKWRKRADEAEKKLKAIQAEVATLRTQHERDLAELAKISKAAEVRYAAEHEKHLEAEKHFDRANRKLKSVEKQIEEFEAENKKLKKQVRQQQEQSEEQKKELVGLQAKNAELETLAKSVKRAAPAAAPPAAKEPEVARVAPANSSILPQDQAFTWTADGRVIKVTAREIKRAIDKNDENYVFGLIQALGALKRLSPDGHSLLLTRLREIDRFYARVVSERTTRMLVDASNVARYEKNRFGKGQLRLVMAMRDELRRRNCFPIRFIADASLPHNIDAPEDLQAMIKRGEMEVGPSGQEADDILAREARRTGAYVVSNDRSFHHKASPGFEPPRVGFHFFDHHVVVDDF